MQNTTNERQGKEDRFQSVADAEEYDRILESQRAHRERLDSLDEFDEEGF